MTHHRMHSPTGLMRALESGFALGCGPIGHWAWIRLSPGSDSDSWDIEYGGWGSIGGLATLMEDLIRHPWRWHIGLVEDTPEGFRGDFKVTIEDTLDLDFLTGMV